MTLKVLARRNQRLHQRALQKWTHQRRRQSPVHTKPQGNSLKLAILQRQLTHHHNQGVIPWIQTLIQVNIMTIMPTLNKGLSPQSPQDQINQAALRMKVIITTITQTPPKFRSQVKIQQIMAIPEVQRIQVCRISQVRKRIPCPISILLMHHLIKRRRFTAPLHLIKPTQWFLHRFFRLLTRVNKPMLLLLASQHSTTQELQKTLCKVTPIPRVIHPHLLRIRDSLIVALHKLLARTLLARMTTYPDRSRLQIRPDRSRKALKFLDNRLQSNRALRQETIHHLIHLDHLTATLHNSQPTKVRLTMVLPVIVPPAMRRDNFRSQTHLDRMRMAPQTNLPNKILLPEIMPLPQTQTHPTTSQRVP